MPSQIPVVILAGGLGTRMREETEFRPKPMVNIGGKPIIWHIMKNYAAYGHSTFIVCLGYKGEVIRDFFLNYHVRNSDFTVTLGTSQLEVHEDPVERGWRVTMSDTGLKTNTGGRLLRVAKYLRDDLFMLTYGDGVGDIDINQLLQEHQDCGKLATVTAVRPSSRFGELYLENNIVSRFEEKPQVANSWINGGFLVMHRSVLNLLRGDEDHLEADLLKKLANMGQLSVHRHFGFWQCMDTIREVELLNRLAEAGQSPWIVQRNAPPDSYAREAVGHAISIATARGL